VESVMHKSYIGYMYATVMSVDWTKNKIWRVWWGPLVGGGPGARAPWAPLKSGPVMYDISIGATMHSLTTNEIQVFFVADLLKFVYW